jgi:hypothetical protein
MPPGATLNLNLEASAMRFIHTADWHLGKVFLGCT